MTQPRLRLAPLLGSFAILGLMACSLMAVARQAPADPRERYRVMSKEAEAKGLAEPFKGITTNGRVVPGLFPLRSTGVSTEPVRKAAEDFLATLTDGQRSKTTFAVDDPEWRKWMNQHFYIRQGVSG